MNDRLRRESSNVETEIQPHRGRMSVRLAFAAIVLGVFAAGCAAPHPVPDLGRIATIEIRGVVQDGSGTPAPDAVVRVTQLFPETSPLHFSERAASDGSFLVRLEAGGQCEVWAEFGALTTDHQQFTCESRTLRIMVSG